MRRFRRLIEENPEQPFYIPEICNAIGVPDRTLRACCQAHLGMGPKRYLLLRRMHLVRRALREAASDTGSVTEIGCSAGDQAGSPSNGVTFARIWSSFGRFATRCNPVVKALLAESQTGRASRERIASASVRRYGG